MTKNQFRQFVKTPKTARRFKVLKSIPGLLFAAMMLICITCSAQKTDTTKAADSIMVYSIALTQVELEYLLNLLKTADEKPSMIIAERDLILSRIKSLGKMPIKK